MSPTESAHLKAEIARLRMELADLALSHAELSSLVARLVVASLWPGHQFGEHSPGDLLARGNSIADQALETSRRLRGEIES